MVTRLYANNFRCLVGFKAEFNSFGILCGPNGSGKSSVFDALRLIRSLATGDGICGGDRDQDIARLEFSQWQRSSTQEFELAITSDGRAFEYIIHLEQKADFEKPRIVNEQASCDGKKLFERNLEGVRFMRSNQTEARFPLDWRQAALASIQPKGTLTDLQTLQEAMARLLILRPNPRGMERESKAESKRPDLYLAGLTSWYRSLQQDYLWTKALHDRLQEIWPDFNYLKLVDVGLNTKALQLHFGGADGAEAGVALYFDQLSDGEKALIGLYMVQAALATDAIQTVLIDEPDNYIGLPELQPWVLSLRELLDRDHQALLITHHPEILSSAGREHGYYLWRDNHTSPTRIGPLNIPEGLTPGEAVARGWVRG